MITKNSGMAIASFVLGLCSLPLGWIPFLGQIISILAIVFGIIALNQIKKNKKLSGKPFAIWGIVLGSLWLAIFIITIIAGIVWVVVKNVGEGFTEAVNNYSVID